MTTNIPYVGEGEPKMRVTIKGKDKRKPDVNLNLFADSVDSDWLKGLMHRAANIIEE